MTKRKARSKPNRKNRNPRPLTVSLAADVIQFLDDSIELSEYDITRSRMVEDCIQLAQAMVVAGEILQALRQLQKGRTDDEHLENCRGLIGAAQVLINETKSEVLVACTVPLDAAIRAIDEQWLQTTVDDAEKVKK